MKARTSRVCADSSTESAIDGRPCRAQAWSRGRFGGNMRQSVTRHGYAEAYAQGVEGAWATWEPSLRRAERLLRVSARSHADAEEIAAGLGRSQYAAHASSELALGLEPPPGSQSAHVLLVETMAACRDTLGVLSLRSELDELDEESRDIGLHAIHASREAFAGARGATGFPEVVFVDTGPAVRDASSGADRAVAWLLWGLVATCVVLFTALLFEVFLLTPLS